MPMTKEPNPSPPHLERRHGPLYDLGCRISEWVSNLAAHPFVQIGFVIFCLAWFALGLETNLLTAALSILAITLTQMVLNRQNEREAEAHRRDVAMHAKLDELVIASRRAHNDYGRNRGSARRTHRRDEGTESGARRSQQPAPRGASANARPKRTSRAPALTD
jgi:low affinity Fe/Cu permease